MLDYAPGHIQGFIALRRNRAHQRLTTALKYLAVAVLIILGTGTVTLISDAPATPDTRIVVDLADCPPRPHHLDADVVTFTIAMRGDGTPEVKRCTRWQGRAKPRAPQ